MSNQNEKKNNYKERVISKLERQIEKYKENSGSWIFMDRIGQITLEILGWSLLIGALYLYIKSGRGLTIGCDRISVDLCNNCYGQAKLLFGGLLP